VLNRYRAVPAAVLAAAALVGMGAAVAVADESADVSFKVKAPIDAVSCTTTPPTVTVLGLIVDTTNAAFEGPGESEGDDDGGPGATPTDCSSLVVGTSAEVTLTGDVDPLTATKVESSDSGGASLLGPIQLVDAGAHTLTLYGLTIDASHATAEGDDDDGQPATPVDLTQLSVGQFVDVRLDASQLPALVADRIEARNFTNEVEVDLEDQSGQQVDDDTDSVDVSVDQTVVVAVQSRVHGVLRTRHVRRTIHIHQSTNGSFVLSGLAKGRATIKVTRVQSGKTTAARRVAVVHKNKTTKLTLRLRPTRTK
jgi:hypothetical protein